MADAHPVTGVGAGNFRVVEMTLMVAGPTCGLMLSQLGAEVIKIETASRGGQGRENWNWTETNGGKFGASLDLKQAEGITLLKELLSVRVSQINGCEY